MQQLLIISKGMRYCIAIDLYFRKFLKITLQERSYFVNPLRLNSNSEYVLNKLIVYLSRAKKGENILILFPLFASHLKPNLLLQSFHEFVASPSNSGKSLKIVKDDHNQQEQVVADGEVNQNLEPNHYYEYIGKNESVIRQIDQN